MRKGCMMKETEVGVTLFDDRERGHESRNAGCF